MCKSDQYKITQGYKPYHYSYYFIHIWAIAKFKMAANPRWPPFFIKSGVWPIHFGYNSKSVCLMNTKSHMDIHSITTTVSVLKISVISKLNMAAKSKMAAVFNKIGYFDNLFW